MDDDEQDLPEFYDSSAFGVERMNWTDPVIAVMTTVVGVIGAFHNGASYMLSSIRLHGRTIAEKQEFEKTVGRQIEAMTDGR